MPAEQGGFEPVGYMAMTPGEVYLRVMFSDAVGYVTGMEQTEADRATAADVGRPLDESFNSGDYACQTKRVASLPNGFDFSARAIRRFGYPNEFAPIEPDILWVNVASPQGQVSLRMQMPARLDIGVEGRSRSHEELLPPRSAVYLQGDNDVTVRSVVDLVEDELAQSGERHRNIRGALAAVRYLASRSDEIDLATGHHVLTAPDVEVVMDFLALFMRVADYRDIMPDRELGARCLASYGITVLPRTEVAPPAYGRNEPAVLSAGDSIGGQQQPGSGFEPGVYGAPHPTGIAAMLGVIGDGLRNSRENITTRAVRSRRWLGMLANRFLRR